MNAKQEILDALWSMILSQRSARVYEADALKAEARIRVILETHELVPVGLLKQIAQAIDEADGVRCPDCGNSGVRTVLDRNGDPEPAPCEWCHRMPWSQFNVGILKKKLSDAIPVVSAQRWLKPSEITEPGAYWVADTRGGPQRKPRRHVMPMYAVNIAESPDGLREWNTMFGRLLSQWDKHVLLLGPIRPPEYKGD